MPRSAFIRGILRCEMNIGEFYYDLQATLAVFLLQINRRVWFSRWFEIFRLRLLDRFIIRSRIVNPQIVRPVARIEGPKSNIL